MSDLREAILLGPPRDLSFEIKHTQAALLGIQRRYSEAGLKLISLASQARTPKETAKAIGHLAQVRYAEGNVRAAAALAAQALEAADDHDYLAFLRSNLAWYTLLLGDWSRTRALLTTGISKANEAGDLWTLVNLKADQARLEAWSGHLPLAIDLGKEAVSIARRLATATDLLHAQDALATAFLEAGEAATAAATLAEAMRCISAGSEPRDLALACCNYAEALLRQGDYESSRQFLDEAGHHLRDSPVFAVLCTRLRAEYLMTTGEIALARDYAESSIETPSEFLLSHAEALELTAKIFAITNSRMRAMELASGAQQHYEALGAVRRSERVGRWLEKQQSSRAGRPRSTLPYGLTRRETEILWLVTQGKTNREIGASLFISEGTVSKHVDNIKRKAGRSRRTELVTFAARLGITPDTTPDVLADA